MLLNNKYLIFLKNNKNLIKQTFFLKKNLYNNYLKLKHCNYLKINNKINLQMYINIFSNWTLKNNKFIKNLLFIIFNN